MRRAQPAFQSAAAVAGRTPELRDRASGFDRVHRRILSDFPELVASQGGNAEAIFRLAGIDPDECGDNGADVSYRQIVELTAIAATRLDCPDFGMRLARLQAVTIESPLQRVVSNARTLGEALESVVSYSFAHSLAASIWLRRDSADDEVKVGHDILIDGAPDRRQAIEHILLMEYLTCRNATAGLVRARRVEFRHQPVAPPAAYRAHFGCDVRFGERADAIVYTEQSLTCPIVAADPATFDRTIAHIDETFPEREPPLHVAVRGAVLGLLGSDQCTNTAIARLLGLHPRALHRGLRVQGTSFQRVKNEVRRDLLARYLDQTDLPVSEISERLGFAEQSAMTRFCRKWLGASPTGRRAGAKRPA